MEVYPISEQLKERIWKSHNVTRKEINEKIDVLKEWIKTQPHLPQKMPYESFFEKMLLITKFRVEVAKEKIDNYFTLKAQHKKFYECLSDGEWLLPSQCGSGFYPLPKLGPDDGRIIVYNEKTPYAKDYDFEKNLFIMITLIELGLRYDYPATSHIIFDCENFRLAHLPRVNFKKFRIGASILFGVYSSRVASIEVVNAPSFISVFITAIKFVVNPKILDRIYIHPNLESLHNNIPPDYLPVELGGNQGSVVDLIPTLDKAFEDERQFISSIMDYKSDLSLLPKKDKKGHRKGRKSHKK